MSQDLFAGYLSYTDASEFGAIATAQAPATISAIGSAIIESAAESSAGCGQAISASAASVAGGITATVHYGC